MNAKFLLLALPVAAFSSCSTVYKSGQTPDDVYFSPIRTEENVQQHDAGQDNNTVAYNKPDASIRMSILDRRWRDFNDYDYNYSPYNYCYCNCTNTYSGYYYNPSYYPGPIYTTPVKINTTPRMVNLNNYHNYNTSVATGIKNGGAVLPNNTTKSGLGGLIRQAFSSMSSDRKSAPSSTNDRTYTPSSSNNNSSGSSSSSSSSGTTNTRPARGN